MVSHNAKELDEEKIPGHYSREEPTCAGTLSHKHGESQQFQSGNYGSITGMGCHVRRVTLLRFQQHLRQEPTRHYQGNPRPAPEKIKKKTALILMEQIMNNTFMHAAEIPKNPNLGQ
jgi:hypothetical protein